MLLLHLIACLDILLNLGKIFSFMLETSFQCQAIYCWHQRVVCMGEARWPVGSCPCFCSDLDVSLGESCWVSLWKSFLLEWSTSLERNHLFFCLWGISLIASVLGAKRVKGTVGSCNPRYRLIESHFSHVSHASSQLYPLFRWSLIHLFLSGLCGGSGLAAQVQGEMWGVSLLLAQISAHLHPCSAQKEPVSVLRFCGVAGLLLAAFLFCGLGFGFIFFAKLITSYSSAFFLVSRILLTFFVCCCFCSCLLFVLMGLDRVC